ncbi:unnamed protein product [Periconia digitata]|uniref:Uncharacterized protein n=1 Tax=Periconia digitata TaxID=1303443 RepID=A0A9W4UBT2_9PLEO|nr:unnamed protein product [Periconia digitata]
MLSKHHSPTGRTSDGPLFQESYFLVGSTPNDRTRNIADALAGVDATVCLVRTLTRARFGNSPRAGKRTHVLICTIRAEHYP